MKSRLWVFLIICAIVGSSQAEPQYGVLMGQSCFLCHLNPSGRGLRSLYGSQFFAPAYLSAIPIGDSALAAIKPQLSSSVIIGGDIRSIWMSESSPYAGSRSGLSGKFSANTGTDALMAGSLYLNFQPIDRFSLRFTQDLLNLTRFEAYGMATVLPFHGYVKVGRFQENYGWSFTDHTSYVRSGLWGGWNGDPLASPTPPGYGVGGEVGFLQQPFTITGSYTDDAGTTPPNPPPGILEPGPFDTQKRWVARAMIQKGIPKTGLEGTIGGSYFHAPAMNGVISTRQTWWGGFGGIGWQGLEHVMGSRDGFGFLATAALFEYDRKAWTPVYGGQVTSAYSTSQLFVQVYPGAWITGAYDWLDNSGHKDGNEGHRTSIGLQLQPWPWVDLLPMYRLDTPPSMSGYSTKVRHLEVQAHFQF